MRGRYPVPGVTASDDPLNDFLTSWWMFRPLSGGRGTLDDLKGGSPLTLSGGYSFTTRNVAAAPSFSSSTSRTDGPNVFLHATLHTVEIITKTPSGNTQYVSDFGTAGAGDSNRAVLFYSANNFNIYNKGYPTGVPSATEIQYAGADVWQQIIYTTNGSTLNGYRNGVRVLSVAAGLNTTAGYYQHYMGTFFNGSTQFYQGAVLSERVYARFLSDADAYALYEDWQRNFPRTIKRVPLGAYANFTTAAPTTNYFDPYTTRVNGIVTCGVF